MSAAASLSETGLPAGPLTLEQWHALGEDPPGYRLELHDGMLVVSPKPMPVHMAAAANMWALLRGVLAEGWVAVPECDVLLWPNRPTVLAPDVVVFSRSFYDSGLSPIPSDQALLVVEVVSPSSRRTDLKLKRQKYAEAGISHYWIVDLEARKPEERFLALVLADGAYDPQSALRGDMVQVAAPVELEFRLGDLAEL